MSTPLCSEGIVKNIEGNSILVEITMKSACASCQAKGVCPSIEMKQEIIKATSVHPEELAVGDRVKITMERSMGGKAVTIGYLLPLFVMVGTLFVAFTLSNNELLSVILALVFTAIYYLIVWLFGKKIDRQFTFYAEKEESIL